MRKNRELMPKDLKASCNPDMFKIATTKEIDDYSDLVYGQERGIKALNFGIDIDLNGYNMYLEGSAGVGKTMYTHRLLSEKAKEKPIPNDWVYVYNFDNPNEPVAISFTAGEGIIFKKQMEDFVKDIRKELKKTFNNKDFDKEKKMIKADYEEKKEALIEKLNKKTMMQGFKVEATDSGFYMKPVLDGKVLEEEEFDRLDDEMKRDFEDRSVLVQEQIFETLSQIKMLEKQAENKVDEWQSSIALLTINVQINSLKANYKKNKKITTYLEGVKDDILKNISAFLSKTSDEKMASLPPHKQEAKQPWLNYQVNLVVDNSKLEGAPVVMDSDYSFHSIFGGLEYENTYGSLKTDYTMIKPGLLHEANGGYIMFQAKDLLANPACYEQLKKSLRIKQLLIENPTDQRNNIVMVSIKPEPIPLNVKVLIIGSDEIYQTLLTMDEDFRKLFKIKVEFEEQAPRTTKNILRLANFVKSYCSQEKLLDLDKEALAKVVEITSKMSGDKEKLSTQFSNIGEIVGEASSWAKMAKSKVITKEFVQKALDERLDRIKKYDSKYLEMIKSNTLLIDTTGYKVGQINGLTVISIGDYSFGKPARITANTYMGKAGVVNIENQVDLSGSSHSKGVLILSGYLGQMFAQDILLSLTASICFEQLYGGIDGDSASSTELYAILSSLADIPINQSIAVTGSVNQKGEIQPIGGVNEKIEGFYQICKMRGFNGENGVIIPVQNIRNLSLSDEIIDSVSKGEFHIYAIETIDEGIEILTGVPAGAKNKDGKFPLGTINYLVYEKLKKFSKASEKNN